MKLLNVSVTPIFESLRSSDFNLVYFCELQSSDGDIVKDNISLSPSDTSDKLPKIEDKLKCKIEVPEDFEDRIERLRLDTLLFMNFERAAIEMKNPLR